MMSIKYKEGHEHEGVPDDIFNYNIGGTNKTNRLTVS